MIPTQTTQPENHSGTTNRVHNSILLAFFSEVRRLSEEAARRERAANLQFSTNSAPVEAQEPQPKKPALKATASASRRSHSPYGVGSLAL